MSELGEGRKISRRTLLKVGAAAALVGGAGLVSKNLISQESEEPQFNWFLSEVREVPDRKTLLQKLLDKYSIDETKTQVETFNISAKAFSTDNPRLRSLQKGQTDSSFILVGRSERENEPWNRVFIAVDNNVVELLPTSTHGQQEFTWYIPSRDAVLGIDIANRHISIPGATGIEPVLMCEYNVKDPNQFIMLRYKPPKKQQRELFGDIYKDNVDFGWSSGRTTRGELPKGVNILLDRRIVRPKK